MENPFKLDFLNFNVAISRLEHEVIKDWFQDPIFYKDILDINYLKDYIENLFDYNPLKVLPLNIPKKNFVFRYSYEIVIYERIIYQAIVDYMIKFYDIMISSNVYSYRYNNSESSKYIYKHPIHSWKNYIIKSEMAFQDSPDNVLLIVDITNYFEDIDFVILKNILKNKIDENEKTNLSICIDVLFKIFESFSYSKGIPQNRLASSFLGNIYLNSIDNLNYGDSKYFRYMDDIRIVCKNKYLARTYLQNIINELRNLNLNVNSQKTKILNFEEAKKNQLIYLIDDNRKLEEIEILVGSKNYIYRKIALEKLLKIINNCIKEKIIDEKIFKFTLYRIALFAKTKQFSSYDYDNIVEFVLEHIVDYPWLSNTFVFFLKSIKLSKNNVDRIIYILNSSYHNIYEWKNYLLWTLLIDNQRSEKELIELAIQNIKNSNTTSDCAGSINFLVSQSKKEYIIFIAKKFKTFNNPFIQRISLIALKDLSPKELEEYVSPYIPNELIHMFNNLKKNYAGSYFLSTDNIDDVDIYSYTVDVFSG